MLLYLPPYFDQNVMDILCDFKRFPLNDMYFKRPPIIDKSRFKVVSDIVFT
jgi:hypothetical protein